MSKPIVHYRGKAEKFGDRALLYPVNHPNHMEGHCVSNTMIATTSKVVAWVGDRIETQNTVYMPEN